MSPINELLNKKQEVSTKGGWWTQLSPRVGGSLDYYGGQREPSPVELVAAFNDLAYICVKYISQILAHANVRLYVRTASGQRQPKYAVAPVSQKHVKQMFIGQRVEEVVDHPALDLLSCNPLHNKAKLLEGTVTYLDTAGDAFWRIVLDGDIPRSLILLPSHLVTPDRDDDFLIKRWVLNRGMKEQKFPLEQVVHVSHFNPEDPLGMGKSPLRAAWERYLISRKELSYLSCYFDNQGRPDALVSVKEGVMPDQMERLAKEFYQRYSGSGNGGVLFLDGTMNYAPLSYGAKDYAELEVFKNLKVLVANHFQVPPDVFELGVSSNRSTKLAAMYSLARDCLTPRIRLIVEAMNNKILPYFNKYADGRLFFEADSLLEADEEHELAVDQMLLSNRAVLDNEVRVKYGYEPLPWGDERLLPSGVMPADAFAPPTPPPTIEPPKEPTVDRTAQASAIQTLQQAVYAGQLPREAGLAQLRILYGFDAAAAELLLPDIAPKPPSTTSEATEPDEATVEPTEESDAPEDKPDEQADPVPKAIRQKMVRMLAPASLIKALQTFFKKLEGEVVGRMKAMSDIETKAIEVKELFDFDQWTEEMLKDMTPVLEAYYDFAAQQTLATLNLAPSLFTTVQPKLREGVDQAAFEFCQATLDTTRLDLKTAQETLRKEITEGLVEGDTRNELMKRVQTVFSEADTERAFKIGATEASRGQHNAMMITAKESGVVKGKTWLLSNDACELCLPLRNKTVGLEDVFVTDGAGPYAQIKAPPRHPYCLLGETPVLVAGTEAAMKAHYSGPCVRVIFGSGDNLSCTPNHMLLTPTGFARAADLVEGEDVVYCPLTDGLLAGVPDDQREPTEIEKVVTTLAKTSGVSTNLVPVAAEHFHGDGGLCQGYVEVVGANGSLPDVLKRAEAVEDELLASRGDGRVSLSGEGGLASLLKGLLPASDGVMSMSREEQALLWGQARHADEHGFTSTSGEQAEFLKAANDCRAAYAQNFAHCQDRLPGVVQTTKVVKVERFDFSGHVYDLQNRTTLNIVCNGIISSNCRCNLLLETE